MPSKGQKSRLGRGLASLIGDKLDNNTDGKLTPTSTVLQSFTPNNENKLENEAAIIQPTNNTPANKPDTSANFNQIEELETLDETEDEIEDYSLHHIGYPTEGARVVPITDVRPSHLNPRKDFSQTELDDLATSIRERGMIQPIVVRPALDGSGFEIVAGERRWRAARTIPLQEVPVIIREIEDQELVELAIIENVQRSDLNPIEEAFGYQELMEKFSYTQETMANVIGKSRSYLANVLRLLNLPGSVQDLVREGELSAGHARALIGREDAEELALIILDQGLSVRETEKMVNSCAVGQASATQVKSPEIDILTSASGVRDVNVVALEKEIADRLGLKVQIKQGKGESGELRLKYSSFEQFENLRNLLGKTEG